MRWITLGFLLCIGCFGPASQVNSTDGIIATGHAQKQDGSAMAAAQVELIRHQDAWQTLGDVFTTLATLGIACLTQQVDICSTFQSVKTDSSGEYQFAMRGEDTQGSTNQALLFTAFLRGSTPMGATRPAAVGVDFHIQETRLAMPDLRLWEAVGTEQDGGGDTALLDWETLPSNIGSASGYRVVLTTSDNHMIWSTTATTNTVYPLDRRVTQDFAGQWSVWAQRTTHDDDQSTDWEFTHYSPARSWASKNLIPRSRGKDCYVHAENTPQKQSPCTLTDGKLSTRFQKVPTPQCPQGQMCTPPPQNQWVYVDLGTSQPLSLLVLYDVAATGASGLIVEGSNDATSWTALATTDLSKYHTVTLAGSARYVRLNFGKGEISSSGNSEIAIY
jgi:hypothetical protein